MTPVYQPAHEADIAGAARMIHHAFAGPLDGAEKWLRDAGIEHVRVVREGGGSPTACLLRIPMGQHFGGRGVPMLGIAGVATAPEARGRGLGRVLMHEAVREAARDGFAISTLYPSVPALYRQAGYEYAGHRFVTTIPLGRIDIRERSGAIRPLTDGDDPAVHACYARFAAAFDGSLERGRYCWSRVREMRGDKYAGFGVDDGRGGLDGYVFIAQVRDARTGFHDVATTDLVFTTGAAGRRLLGFLADFATMGDNATVFGGPLHPAAALMSSRHQRVEKKDYWMVRILDVARALEARGYRAAVAARLHLEVHDELVPENSGAWRLEVEAGRARVSRGSGDALRCDIRALAPLYSGLCSARQLVLLGWAAGSDEAVAAADAVFASSGGPWMIDMF